ncbi:hypothetical protein [Methylocystis echinoides]|uniref:Uncharacterized protein n=1 Tax=Methylocystis echinoides TaxID=29468 RepID=A0A9W6LR56_9HYPH|nr:hypothetical protein [Methylocystis echinoides]GLI92046.1 hypothetical protein LMG27198_10380 [Methylocystis echinoides]
MKYALAVLLLALVAGAALAVLTRREGPDVIHAELAGLSFAYQPAYARDDATAAGGLADRLAFLASFPGFVAGRGGVAPVKLTLTPSEESLDPQERPSKLYGRFLTSETLEGPGGLVLRRFEAESPYESEELLLSPPDGRAFFARCPKAQTGVPGEECLSLFRDGVIDVELRYPRELLEHWDALFDGARDLLARMRRRPARAAG